MKSLTMVLIESAVQIKVDESRFLRDLKADIAQSKELYKSSLEQVAAKGLTREKFVQFLGKWGEGIDLTLVRSEFIDQAQAALRAYQEERRKAGIWDSLPYDEMDLFDMEYPPRDYSVGKFERWTAAMKEWVEKAKDIVDAAAKRAGVKSMITILPEFPERAEQYHVTTYGVDIGKGRVGFTLFLEPTSIGDIMEDAAEEDVSKQEVLDYYNLISEIQKPGSTQTPKWVRLYTARPTKDRKFYETATSLPHGVFLGTDEAHVEGLAGDLGSNERRDLWYGVIDARNLVLTLERGRNKYYMVVGSAAIKGQLELVTPGK